MTTTLPTLPNPDLTADATGWQGWNQPARRRHGFHNAHRLWRRQLTLRSRHVLQLEDRPDSAVTDAVHASGVTTHPAFSALVVAQGHRVLYQQAAADFAATQPHSLQSISKIHMHLLMAELIAQGRVDPEVSAGTYLPFLGSGYAGARIRDLLDMNVVNSFSEDYADPNADCYAEESALGWRLAADGTPEPTLAAFVAGIGSDDLLNRSPFAAYKSANTDVLTLIAAATSPVYLASRLEAIADAAGYEGTFHITLSPELLPALSGGACLSARDLARFGLLLARNGEGVAGGLVGDGRSLTAALGRDAPVVSPVRHWLRYANHVMTDGRHIGHAGYGGQYLMVDMTTGRTAAFLSVLTNDAGYDELYMANVIRQLESILAA